MAIAAVEGTLVDAENAFEATESTLAGAEMVFEAAAVSERAWEDMSGD